MEEMYSVQQVAKALGVSEDTVRRLLGAQELIGVKIGRVWRVTKRSYDAFVRDHTDEKVEHAETR